jgi:hypothetical protein|tara:strand:- start:1319 stop:1678 length:360 start_codon:yes stop_codon:yes gene_type:complete
MNEQYNQTENVDYELVPVGEASNQQAWHVRILTGDFVETVIVYGNIQFDGEIDRLKFSFSVVSSPIDGLTSEDVDLQNKTTKILENILEVAYNEGSLVTGDDEVGDNTGTDDSEESVNE